MPHVVLLLLVARENADLLDVCLEEPPEDGIAKAPGPPGDHECFVFEDGHIVVGLIILVYSWFDYAFARGYSVYRCFSGPFPYRHWHTTGSLSMN